MRHSRAFIINLIPLTSAAYIKMTHGEVVFNAQRDLTLKVLDWYNEILISAVDWHTAVYAAEEQIHFHHGDIYAEEFVAHYKLVMDLGSSHSWDIATEYNIQ